MPTFVTGSATDFTEVGTETDPTDPLEPDDPFADEEPDGSIDSDFLTDAESPTDQTNYAEPGQGESFAGQDPSIWSIQGDADDGSTFASDTPAIETETLPTDGDEPVEGEPLQNDNPAVENEDEEAVGAAEPETEPTQEDLPQFIFQPPLPVERKWWDTIEEGFHQLDIELSIDDLHREQEFELIGGFRRQGVPLEANFELTPLFAFQQDTKNWAEWQSFETAAAKYNAQERGPDGEPLEEEEESTDITMSLFGDAGYENSPQDIAEEAYTGTEQEVEPELDVEADEETEIINFYAELEMMDSDIDLMTAGEILFPYTSLVEFVDLELDPFMDDDADGFTNFVDETDEDYTI